VRRVQVHPRIARWRGVGRHEAVPILQRYNIERVQEGALRCAGGRTGGRDVGIEVFLAGPHGAIKRHAPIAPFAPAPFGILPAQTGPGSETGTLDRQIEPGNQVAQCVETGEHASLERRHAFAMRLLQRSFG